MKIICRSFIGFILALACTHPAGSQEKAPESGVQFVADVSGVGTNAAAFLEIGVGARAMAMGGAYGAVANDASALYWNPAGIAWVDRPQCELMHNEWLVNTDYEFAGFVLPVPSIRSTFGFSLITLDYGKEVVRTVDRPEGTGETFTGRDLAVALSYGIAFTDRFSFGISGKFINERIWSETSTAAAIDVGVFYSTLVKGLKIGACVNNFGSNLELRGRRLRTVVDPDPAVTNYDRVPVNYKTGVYPLPLLFRVGVSYEKAIGAFSQVLFALDVNHPSNTTESVNLGMECGIADMFFLRGGYAGLFERDAINGLTLGGGVDLVRRGRMGIRIDYSWSDWGVLENAQRFSLGLIF
ncbi:PorV/PorQ family protein [bacterium]|nr:PorV/PorQ family protein [bacterium]